MFSLVEVYAGLFVLRKFEWLTKIGDSSDDDARRISQAVWVHGMRKSLSPLDMSRGRWFCYRIHREKKNRTFIFRQPGTDDTVHLLLQLRP